MRDQLSNDLASLRIDRQQTPTPSSRPWTWVIVVTLLVGGSAAGVWYSGIGFPKTQSSGLFKTEVETTEITLISPVKDAVDLTATGYIVPQTLVKVAPRATGRIEQVSVKEGDTVQKDQVLFVLESSSRRSSVSTADARAAAARARAQTARANLAEVESQLDRQRKLAATGAVAQSTVDDLQSRASVLRSQVSSADAEANAVAAERQAMMVELAEMKISSPITGKLVSRPMAVGDMAGPEKTLVEIADFETMCVEVDVAEAKLEKVKPGAPAEIVLDAYPSKRLRGVVFEVNPRINRAKATGTVKVKVLDGRDLVLPDMAARVSFLSHSLKDSEMGEPPKKVVPNEAVVERNGAKVVFTIDNGKAHSVPLTLGAQLGGSYEVKEGPAVGTKVVRSPPASLADGQAVKDKTGT